MKKNFFSLLCLLIFLIPMEALADTFELLTYTPPSTGWTKQMMTDGVVYRRANGVGLITIYSSKAATGNAEQEFASMWRAKIEAPLTIKAPQPKIETDGMYKVAVGGQNIDAQGTPTAISLVTIVGNGRVIGVSTVSAGDDVLREITTFLNSIKLDGSFGPQASAGPNTIDVDFDVPPGYVSQKDGSAIVIKPTTVDRNTPCFYGISPSRPSSGNLEADARAAFLEPLAGWQIKSEHYNARRGTAAAGWPYFWLRTDVKQMSGGTMLNVTAMAMAFPTGPGRVGIFWGFGTTGPCSVDDLTFGRLFFSLRPRGWTSDGGRAFSKELVGTWRNTEAVGMAQYIFAASGSYEYGQATSTTFGNLETRTGSVGDGKFSVRGSELVLTGGRRAGTYKVRVYDEFSGGMWLKTISVLNTSASPPYEVRYMRVRD